MICFIVTKSCQFVVFKELVRFFSTVELMKAKLFMVFPNYFFKDHKEHVISTSLWLILILCLLFICVSLARQRFISFIDFFLKSELCFIFLLSTLLISLLFFIISFGIYSYISFPAVLYSFPLKFASLLILFLFFFLGQHLQHMEFPRLGVDLEPQLPAYATGTVTPDLRRICDLRHSLWAMPNP